MTTTEFNTNEIERPVEPGSIGAGAEIYRRMERRSKARPMWMTVAPVALLAVAAVGGVIAYEATKTHNTPPPVQAQANPAASAPLAPTVTPHEVATANPMPAAPAPVARVTRPAASVVRAEHARPVLTAAAHKRAVRDANAAGSAGQDTSAAMPPAQRAVNPPPLAATPKPNYAPPSVMAAPAPITASPPPAASEAPAASSQTAPAPQ